MIQSLLLNGNIITLDDARPRASAVAISYGRLVAVGDDAEIARLAGRGTTTIDLDGKTVLPGLTDAHLHWQAQAQSMRSVNVFELPRQSRLRWNGIQARAADAGWRMDHRAGLGAGFVG